MNLKKTLILGLILAALIAYTLKFELPAEKAREQAKSVFGGITKEQIASVELTNANGSFSLVNTAPVKASSAQVEEIDTDLVGKWELDGVKGSRLDAGRLNSLLAGLLALKTDSPIPDDELEGDLAVYGLDKPAATLKVKHGEQATQIKLGKLNEYVSRRYAQLGDSPAVYLIPDTLYQTASRAGIDFRNRSIVDFTDSELSSLSVQGKERNISIEALSGGKWKLIEPLTATASATAVSAVTMAVRNLRAAEFVDGAAARLGEYNLTEPALRLKLVFKSDLKRAPAELRLGTTTTSVDGQSQVSTYAFLEGGETVFKLESDPSSALLKPVEELREKRLFQFIVSDVERAEFERGPDKLLLERAGEGDEWKVNGKPGDPVFIRDALRNLSEVEAVAFPVDNRDFGFASPALKVSLRLRGAEGSERRLVVGSAAEAGRFFAGADDLAEPFIIPEDSQNKLFPREETLLKPVETPQPLLTPAN